jgi:Exopolysaccharide biosynthesis protein related to N-acetylglucosamine-1-phosphodiester alpha-N-acetylglucosaminidase
VRQLPLGAVRLNGSWLSGPILNRGAIGWDPGERLAFGRLRLNQELILSGGERWGLGLLNSGFVQRGLSRYTRAWGPYYRALSGEEQALSVRAGRVVALHSRAELARGVPLASGTDLIVARGGAPLPASLDDAVEIKVSSSSPLGERSQVLGGGPLLLSNGRVVLNGRQEGFSAGFMALRAPRTVVAQDQQRLWLMTIEGARGSDPTLLETSLALQQLGLGDALNLDGGSSTSLLVANQLVMTGRSFPPRVQNALGLVPE